MRTKLIALALAAMLAIGTGGVVAAGTSSGTPAEQLPDNYTVEITDPSAELSSDEVDEAIATAWSNDQVQSAIDVSDGLHFEVVAGTEQVEVHVKPGPDAETEVVAEISPDGTVTEVFEPELTADESMSSSLSPDEYETVEQSDAEEQTGDEYDVKLNADESIMLGTDEYDVELTADESMSLGPDEYDEKLDAEESMTLGIDILDQTFGDDHLLFNATTT
jgi:hypothetical protein